MSTEIIDHFKFIDSLIYELIPRKKLNTIFIASVNVTLNSLRILAWVFNFLLQASDGGAALSDSN